jgi:FMN phosphatase YigB (HAD superfamily)
MPDDALFIDDLEENVRAAAALGINAFHFTSAADLLAELSHLKLWAI